MAGLSITRREGETIRVGDDIAVTLVRIRGQRITLRIEAPKDIPIRLQPPPVGEDSELKLDPVSEAELAIWRREYHPDHSDGGPVG